MFEKLSKRVYKHFGIKSIGYQRAFILFFAPFTLFQIPTILAFLDGERIPDGVAMFWWVYIFILILPYPIRWVQDGFKIDDNGGEG